MREKNRRMKMTCIFISTEIYCYTHIHMTVVKHFSVDRSSAEQNIHHLDQTNNSNEKNGQSSGKKEELKTQI